MHITLKTKFSAFLITIGLIVPAFVIAEFPSNEQPYPAELYALCFDGIDNDGDGLIDMDDPDCPICTDGLDNDGDGLIDMDDPDCPEFWAKQSLDPRMINEGYNTSIRASVVEAFEVISNREERKARTQTNTPATVRTHNTYKGKLAYAVYPTISSVRYETYPQPTRNPNYNSGNSYTRTPSYAQYPGYQSAPSYDNAPNAQPATGYISAPSYTNAPGYNSAPTYQPAPGYQSAPGYQNAPSYQSAPGYISAPAYTSAPAYQNTPGYNIAPAYQPAPGYSQSSGYQTYPIPNTRDASYTSGRAYTPYPTVY